MVKVDEFLVERWMNEYEHDVEVNLAETCVQPFTLREFLEFTGRPDFMDEIMDIDVARNAYGRQVWSFETDLPIPALGEAPVRGVFIRAPIIERVGDRVEVIGRFEDRPVLVRQGHMMAGTFHPELTPDLRVHAHFLEMV